MDVGATVRVDRRGPVAWVRYAAETSPERPGIVDRLDARGLALLRSAVDALAADPAVRVIVFGGPPGRFPRLMDPAEGLAIAALAPPLPGRWIVAGVELAVALLRWVRPLRALLDRPSLARRVALLNLRALQDALERGDQVTIAAIDGAAFGGGLEIALACDLRVASDRADVHLAQPEVLAGVMAGFGATERLPRLVGEGRALELLLVAEALTPEEARGWGLVTRVIPAERFQDEVWELGARLARRSAAAVGGTKRAVRGGSELREVLRVWRSPDAAAGLAWAAEWVAAEGSRADSLPAVLRALDQRDQQGG